MLLEGRRKVVDAQPAAVFRAFCGLSGDRGWPPYNWLRQIHETTDRLVGGVGMRCGRRHPDHLRQGEALDFWRAEMKEKNHFFDAVEFDVRFRLRVSILSGQLSTGISRSLS